MEIVNIVIVVLTLKTILNCLVHVVFERSRSRLRRTICAVLFYLFTVLDLASLLLLYEAWRYFGVLWAKMYNIHPELPHSVLDLLRIESHDCRLKLVCETSKIISSKTPAAAFLLGVIPDSVAVESEFLRGALDGVRGMNCSSLYKPCSQRFATRETFPFISLSSQISTNGGESLAIGEQTPVSRTMKLVIAMGIANIVIVVLTIMTNVTILNCLDLVRFMRSRFTRRRRICVVLVSLFAVAYVVSLLPQYEAQRYFGDLLEEMFDIPRELPGSVFGYLSIESHQCRLKFVCETSKIISSKNTGVASMLKLITDFIAIESEFLMGAFNGVRGMNCSSLYKPCNQPPAARGTFPLIPLGFGGYSG